ncbi:alpha/beta hydrolase [Amycolatopsis sp. NPDC051061]|uniref:alpha/beta fold hydrolase n=1 Tax=Amycolatopsis sp. NPDC051061 TaxID=3155042 RepID=UPI0034467C06
MTAKSPARRLRKVLTPAVATIALASLVGWLAPGATADPVSGNAELKSSASAFGGYSGHREPKPTIVLVHGAFTDASVWRGVIDRLRSSGYPVVAPAIPLRGLASDSAYLAAFLKTVQGPIVLVGHSYAGAVISSAARNNSSVRSLVYVAAFQPDAGETAGGLNAKFPGSKLGPATTVALPYPGGNDVYLKPENFRDVYAGDVDSRTANEMAVTERPVEASALSESFQGAAAWHTIPSWAIVADQDQSLPPALERYMADRAHSKVTSVRSSHAVPVSHPGPVTDVIVDAARSVR